MGNLAASLALFGMVLCAADHLRQRWVTRAVMRLMGRGGIVAILLVVINSDFYA